MPIISYSMVVDRGCRRGVACQSPARTELGVRSSRSVAMNCAGIFGAPSEDLPAHRLLLLTEN